MSPRRWSPLALLVFGMSGLFGCALEVTALEASSPPVLIDVPSDAGAPDAGPAAPSTTYLVAGGDLRFVLLDLKDPAHPVEVAAFDPREGEDEEPLPFYSLSEANERGHVFAGRYGSIEAYGIEPGGIRPLGRIPSDSSHALGLAISGSRLYAALGEEGIRIFDVSDIENPRVLGQIPARRSIHDIELLDANHLAFYDADDSALYIYDVSNPAAPEMMHTWITDFVGSRSAGMSFAGGFLAINAVYWGGGSGLWFWVLDESFAPSSLGFHPEVRAPVGGGVALWPLGQNVFGYFADQESGVMIAEATTERRLARSGTIPGAAMDTLVHERLLYVAQGVGGVVVYALDEGDPEAPTQIPHESPLASGTSRLVRVQLQSRGDESELD